MLEIFRADMLKLFRYEQAREALGLKVTPPLNTLTTLKLSDFTQAESIDGAREIGEGDAPVVNECLQLEVYDTVVNYDDFIFDPSSPSSPASPSSA
jgi:hypothetical protein